MLCSRSFSMINSGISSILMLVVFAGQVAVALSAWRKNTVWYEEGCMLGSEEEMHRCIFTNLPKEICLSDVSSV